MASRLGSLLVVMLLGGLALIAALVIAVLVGDDEAESSAVVVISLRDGGLLLLGETTSIRVVVQDDEPVTGISLLADGITVVRDAVPVANASQGTFGATLNWTPDRLGEVEITVRAISLSGMEAETSAKVEVTDDPQRIAADFQVRIIAPAAFQRTLLGQTVSVLAQARAQGLVSTFTLEVNGIRVAEASARTAENGVSVAVLEWTPAAVGTATLRVIARTRANEEDDDSISVEVLSVEDAAEAAEAEGEGDTAVNDVSGGNDALSIINPDNEDEFAFSEDLRIDIDVQTSATGQLLSMELYVNGAFFVTLQPDRLSDGSYGVHFPFTPSEPGTYILEVVAISQAGVRFDDRIDIVVGDEQSNAGQDSEEEGEEPTRPLPDLVISDVRLNGSGAIVVTISNSGTVPLSSSTFLITVVRGSDGTILGEQTITMVIAPHASRTVTLDANGANETQITVVVDTDNEAEESNEANNGYLATFAPQLDLVVSEIIVSPDRRVIVRVANTGAAAYTGTIEVLLIFQGDALEELRFAGTLAPGAILTFSGNAVLDGQGQLSAVVDPGELVTEESEANNTTTITVSS